MTDPTSQTPRTVSVVYGTRPEAIKMAPIVLALRADVRFSVRVVVTGQHREMLDQVNATFGIAPDADLDIHTAGQSLSGITTRTLAGLESEFETHPPSMVVVQGDTTTTFAASLAGFYVGAAVVHVEAGLRTRNRYDPYPEEINRRLTSQLASVHLAPTESSRRNLLNDGIDPQTVFVTGNTVIDALLHTVRLEPSIEQEELARRCAQGRRIVLVTAHRRESWGEPLRRVGAALARLAMSHQDVDFVFPAHRNPLVREAIVPQIRECRNVVVTEPLPYAQFCALMERSTLILTDSGGVQEEGPSLGKPVLVMRQTTERPEAVSAGTAKLVGTGSDDIVAAVSELLDDRDAYLRMATAVNPYGDGHASSRTVQAMARQAGMSSSRVEEFSAPDRHEELPA